MEILSDFNSIKVRLELAVDPKTIQNWEKFQFHKGAIRTRRRTERFVPRHEFQFHKGAIRTCLPLPQVQDALGFQFHKGAIRTGT